MHDCLATSLFHYSSYVFLSFYVNVCRVDSQSLISMTKTIILSYYCQVKQKSTERRSHDKGIYNWFWTGNAHGNNWLALKSSLLIGQGKNDYVSVWTLQTVLMACLWIQQAPSQTEKVANGKTLRHSFMCRAAICGRTETLWLHPPSN